MTVRFSLLTLAVLTFRCGPLEAQIDSRSDAGQQVDAGAVQVDAGDAPDSGSTFDAGVVDSGAPTDAGSSVDAGPTPAQLAELAVRLDAYVDERMTPDAGSTAAMLAYLQQIHATAADVEWVLRKGRAHYDGPPQALGTVTQNVPISCYSVAYSSVYHIYVPRSYEPKNAVPLVIVGHGGNSTMSAAYARSTALSYINAYKAALGEQLGAIVVAPATERGWSPIGDALIFSTISKVQREYHIDPDRIFVVGQSMGGHLSWRSAMTFTDRWAGVSPQSGGYTDYITTRQIENIYGLVGYGTWGTTEPYGLTQTNQTLKAWLSGQRFPWVMVQKSGGHEIYADEQPKIAMLFSSQRRNLHASKVYLRSAGAMKYTGNWAGQTDVISPNKVHRWNRKRWLEVTPRPTSTDELAVWGEVKSGNRIELTTDKVRQLRVYLHPAMGIDFSRPLTIVVNGATLFSDLPPRENLAQLLETVREFDDRGRVARSFVDLNITTDSPVLAPSY